LSWGFLELLVIQCRACGFVFYIHRSCYRGHAYCSLSCRREGRRRTARRARRNHRHSTEGRADHRDAERERRLRLKVHGRVGDQSSQRRKRVSQPQNILQEILDGHQTHHPDRALVRRSLYPLAALRLRADPAPRLGAEKDLLPAHPLQRTSRPVCIVCGRPGGPLVRVMDRFHL